ncbi:AbrB/MazE/SpoVT family DNA-binding domain-containing protein [Candidatus Pacearchaeota archaeon]|nr:AbrB/MazE/SpoVT family DNA-binding domain-containing protein [Candidatus Pacearchaeota archaeon]
MKEMIFKDGKIQKGYRVKIPKAIVDTLNLKEGQEVIINFNLETNKLTLDIKDEKK